MLKPLLFILTIVSLLALALHFNLFSEVSPRPKLSEKTLNTTELKITPSSQTLIVSQAKTTYNENNLTKELKKLLTKAQKLFQQHKDSEAILLYEEIISKSKNAHELSLLKIFAEACFQKASLHYIYPSYDIDSANETYELLVNTLKNKYNKELLMSYMKGRLQQVQFTSKEELLTAYSEIIEKFQNDKEKRFNKEIEELLFAKSFALMGVNDEEAIEVLDSIITKYKDKSNLPNTVKNSILNNIELSIITANDAEKYIDLANQYMADSPDTKPLLDMLDIIKNAQDLEQSEALKNWKEEHADYIFPQWDFSELRKWVNGMETPESQKRIREYLDIFEKQKYRDIYQPSTPITPTGKEYSDSSTQNIENEPSSANNDETVEYEEIHEPDPYLNDIINTEPEISYPNPYSDYEPNVQTGGVSHTYEGNY